MHKIIAVLVIIGAVIGCYLFMLVVMPMFSDIVSTANTTMAATSNMSNYYGVQQTTLATPWLMFFVPVIIGVVVLVVVLRRQD